MSTRKPVAVSKTQGEKSGGNRPAVSLDYLQYAYVNAVRINKAAQTKLKRARDEAESAAKHLAESTLALENGARTVLGKE